MKRIICAAFAVLACIASTGADAARQSKSELRRQVAALEARAIVLRTQVASLSSEVVKAKMPPSFMEAAKVPIIRTSQGFHDVDLQEQVDQSAALPPASILDRVKFWDRARVVYVGDYAYRYRCLPASLVQVATDTAKEFNTTVQVFSGHRNHSHNRKVGGARRSQHLGCNAMDFRVVGVPFGKVAHYLYRHKYTAGLGLYAGGFFHVDRGRRRIWAQMPASTARAYLGVGPKVHVAGYGLKKKRYAQKPKRPRLAHA